MPSSESRREAIRKFKEQKPDAGIFAVRSTVTGHIWVGATRNLGAAKNSCWFQLRNQLHREQSLQREWDAQGESAFQYEILDCLNNDVHALAVDGLLKDKKSNWVAQLHAQQML